ncbi:MAG: hypothetical protein J07AB43_02790 [Candidatus Nanosalina sp. J07AB43]|jgi:hypothetical protein|nr:MAG: hypothetical protein J07AB43_02790 [Candidatus Nanosalina sp. J07AB43]
MDRVFRSNKDCTLRVKYRYRTRTGPVESIPSLKESVRVEASKDVPVSNVSINVGSEDFVTEVALDIDQKNFTDEDEDKVKGAVGRALIAGGTERLNFESYEYTVVSR